MTAANAATSFSFFAIPIATPMAKRIGRFVNTMSPARLMTMNSAFQKVPGPMILVSPYALSIVTFENEPPMPSKSPAAGSSAIGSMNDLPIL